VATPYPELGRQRPTEGPAVVARAAIRSQPAGPTGPGSAGRRHAASTAARLVWAEEGRSKESSDGDGALAHLCHGERDIEERKRDPAETERESERDGEQRASFSFT